MIRRLRWAWRVARLVRVGVSLAKARESADLAEEIDRMWARGELDRSGR